MLRQPALILASTSRFRRELLGRVFPRFQAVAPDIDETPDPGEKPSTLAARLAGEKALAVATSHPGSVVIGADQVADLAGRPLGKPGSRETARAQLAASSGRDVVFHTAVCVIGRDGSAHEAMNLTRVRFRRLSATDIERYLDREQPFDCAGSFKSEALGIALFEAIESDDPTALIGLPMIATCRLLREAGIDPFD
jgi:septum formation protein